MFTSPGTSWGLLTWCAVDNRSLVPQLGHIDYLSAAHTEQNQVGNSDRWHRKECVSEIKSIATEPFTCAQLEKGALSSDYRPCLGSRSPAHTWTWCLSLISYNAHPAPLQAVASSWPQGPCAQSGQELPGLPGMEESKSHSYQTQLPKASLTLEKLEAAKAPLCWDLFSLNKERGEILQRDQVIKIYRFVSQMYSIVSSLFKHSFS